MRKNNILLYIFMLVVLTVFVYGVFHLLVVRYEAGDIYPPYSSLRADPLGTKAFYEGIDNVQGFSSRRNYQPADKLRNIRNTTIFSLGMNPRAFRSVAKETVRAIDELLLNGNRLVFSFSPVHKGFSFMDFDEEEEEKAEQEEEKEKGAEQKEAGQKEEEKEAEQKEEEEEEEKEQPDDRYFEKPISLAERWGVKFDYVKLPENVDKEQTSIQAFVQDDAGLPAAISWHTALYFDTSEEESWRVIYAANDNPVIIERDFGKGTIVLSADSYFLSNEAMRNERHAELLAWLIGSNPEVLFDETHFGVMESPGIASLIRKYRLGWFVAGLVLLALLFVWKNVFSFVPPHKDTLANEEESGKDITAGLINLLRQNVSSHKVLSVCIDEWEKSASSHQKDSDNVVEEIRAVIRAENARPSRERDPVTCYKTITRILARKK